MTENNNPTQVNSLNPPILVVISGPSGVGKDSVIKQLKLLGKDWHFTVTTTTRKQRPAEENGVDYYFLDEGSFRNKIDSGEFLEFAEVYGHLYGIPKNQVVNALRDGLDVIVKTDVQGARTIKGKVQDAVLIFLVPPSSQDLRNRLLSRQTESKEDMNLRLGAASKELSNMSVFDHVVINDNLETASSKIESIITVEKCRTPPRQIRFL